MITALSKIHTCSVHFGLAALVCCFAIWPAYSDTESETQLRREVQLEWEKNPEATLYEVEVTRILAKGERKKPLYFTLKSSQWRASVHPGQYEMKIRSYDKRKVPGEWSDPMEFWVKIPPPTILFPKNQSKIESSHQNTEKIEFKWEAVEGASAYRLNLVSESGEVSKTLTTEETSLEIELPVATQYNWTLSSVMPEGEISETKNSPHKFTLLGAPIEKPEIERPLSKFVTHLNWKKPEYAERFSYLLYQNTNGAPPQLVEKKIDISESQVEFDLSRPSGTYLIKLIAQAPLRQRSEVAEMEFAIKGGLRSPAAIEQAILRDSIEKPSNYYAIASYYITQISYASQNFETNQKAKFNALGGTGRVGLGYQRPDAPIGIFGIIDMGGFNLGSKNFNFTSAETHGTWRIDLNSASRLLVGTGVYYKELPVLYGNNSEGFQGVGKAKNIGPHIGAQLWLPFSQKVGLQFNARLYYSLLSNGPSGEQGVSAISYQMGALGSYRFKNNIMGYAGYAYRADESSYKANTSNPLSLALPGDLNSIRLEGHYLNLMLEYAF